LASSQATPSWLVTDATHVYWTNVGDRTVMKVPIGGGTPELIAHVAGDPGAIAVDRDNVYWIAQGDEYVMSAPITGGAPKMLAKGPTGAVGIAVDPTMRVPLTGGTASIVGYANVGGYQIALDETNVYTLAPSYVSSTPVAGGPGEMKSPLINNPGGVAVDATSLYWTVFSDGLVVRRTPK
jgi:hypothetical protein